jgi:hypothetical protein
MNFSNEEVMKVSGDHAVRLDCSSSHHIVFDYYDGIERGLLLSPDGAVGLLDSLADSESRSERAFELCLLKIEWTISNKRRLEYVNQHLGDASNPILSEQLRIIEQSAYSAKSDNKFLAIAPIDLTKITLLRTSEDEMGAIKLLTSNELIFGAIKNIIETKSHNR